MAKLKITGLGWVEYEGKNLDRIRTDWKNPSIPRTTQIDLGFFQGMIGDISNIFSGNGGDSQIQSRSKKPHWVIYNALRDTIWKSSYTSVDEAVAEKSFSELGRDWQIKEM